MLPGEINFLRLQNQQLIGSAYKKPEDLVKWHGWIISFLPQKNIQLLHFFLNSIQHTLNYYAPKQNGMQRF